MIYTVDSFDYSIIRDTPCEERRQGNQGHSAKKNYKALTCAFDIETTNYKPLMQGIMYIWQFAIEDDVIIGRTWNEYDLLMTRICAQLRSKETLIIFVHNLAFEFQFLRGQYTFEPDEVFAISRRKVVKATMFENKIEWRCSYMLSNMSLDRWLDSLKVESQKLTLDYSVQRFPWTPLTENELAYCVNDVKGIVQAVKLKKRMDNDSFYTLPLTNTGYVRRDIKRAMKSFPRAWLRSILPDEEVFLMCRQAFRGGNCHSNRYYAGGVITANSSSNDIRSCYPGEIVNKLFPMGRWYIKKATSLDTVAKYKAYNYAFLITVTMEGLCLKNVAEPVPYIPAAKCLVKKGATEDNGRVLAADIAQITLTDIDLDIVLDTYTFDNLTINKFAISKYGPLPRQIKEVVIDYYTKKQALKGDTEQEYFYMKAKNQLNSVYGCSVQNPCRPSVRFYEELSGEGDPFIEEIGDVQTLLEKAYRQPYQSYAWGVWTTAHARLDLQELIKICGSNLLYCDTDSVKYIDDGTIDFSLYNEVRKNALDDIGCVEPDGSYDRFITYGSKKYAYEKDGKAYITIAGVNKKKGSEYLNKCGGLDALKTGFIFPKCTTTSWYNDSPYGVAEIEGHKIDIRQNVYIEDADYTLGITAEYERLLQYPELWLNMLKDFNGYY